jgi:cytochrome c biogenesis protein CcdA
MSFVLSIPQISFVLQRYMNRLLGPILVIVGLILLEVIQFNLPRLGGGDKTQKFAESSGLWGAFLLGVLFALSFCPISAALFFGSLIPLSLTYESQIIFPAFYGFGTGLPVILFAIIISFGAQSVGKAFDIMTRIELWFRRITGMICIVLGLYFTLRYVFDIL